MHVPVLEVRPSLQRRQLQVTVLSAVTAAAPVFSRTQLRDDDWQVGDGPSSAYPGFGPGVIGTASLDLAQVSH